MDASRAIEREEGCDAEEAFHRQHDIAGARDSLGVKFPHPVADDGKEAGGQCGADNSSARCGRIGARTGEIFAPFAFASIALRTTSGTLSRGTVSSSPFTLPSAVTETSRSGLPVAVSSASYTVTFPCFSTATLRIFIPASAAYFLSASA